MSASTVVCGANPLAMLKPDACVRHRPCDGANAAGVGPKKPRNNPSNPSPAA